MRKGVMIACGLIIVLWSGMKITQLSTLKGGRLYEAMDYTAPSLATLIVIVCAITFIVLMFKGGSSGNQKSGSDDVNEIRKKFEVYSDEKLISMYQKGNFSEQEKTILKNILIQHGVEV